MTAIRTGVYGLSAVATPSGGPVLEGEAGDAVDVFSGGEAERYVQLARIGEGGMGEVLLVLDLRLRRQVALKVPRGATARARLAREAFITSQLEHPGIVAIYDAGTGPNGAPYYTMRLVRGRSFEERLGPRESGADLASHIRHLLAACEAVGFAHRAGVVHRDLKPTNIMVGDHGETVVVDWGLALTVDELDRPCTEVAGTPGYMSPEQLRGARLDTRSDVWSLGAILLRVLSGHPPGFAPTSPEGRSSRTGEPVAAPHADAGPVAESRPHATSVDLGALPADVPRELVAIAERALRTEPGGRYPDAAAMAADLENWLLGRRVGAYDYSPLELARRLVRAWRVPLITLAASLVALAIVGALSAQRVVAERDRALIAERAASAALAISDRNLARALVGIAEKQRDEGALAEAGIAAAAALGSAPPFGVRSVQETHNHSDKIVHHGYSRRILDVPRERLVALGLAAQLDVPRPRIAGSVPLPACSRLVLSETGEYSLCLTDGVIHRLGGGPPRVLATLGGGLLDGAISGERVFISRRPAELLVHELSTGLPRDEPPLLVESPPRLLVVPGASESLWLIWGFTALRHRDAVSDETAGLADTSASRETFVACPERDLLLEAIADVGRHAVSLCNDGVLRTLALADGGETVVVGEVRLGDHGRAIAVHGDRLYMLTENGRLMIVVVDDAEPRLLSDLETGLASVRDLRMSPDGGLLVAVAEGLGPTLIVAREASKAHDPRLSHRLPAAWGAGARFAADGTLTTFANAPERRALVRWRLPEREVAIRHGRVGDAGVASVAITTDPERPGRALVVIGRGDGEVTVAREDGVVTARRRFGSQVVKRVEALGQRLFVATMQHHQILELDLGLVEVARWGNADSRFRRVVALSDGTLIGADYTQPLARLEIGRQVALSEHPSRDLSTSPDRAEAVSLSLDGELAVTDGHSLTPLGRFQGAIAAAVDAAGFVLALVDEVLLLDRSGHITRRLALGADRVLDVSVGSGRIALARSDGRTHLLDREGAPLAILGGHRERVAQVEFALGALWSGSWDGTVLRYSVPGALGASPAPLVELALDWGIGLSDVFE